MFKDYYSILDVHLTANQENIKTAFKKQALKWHPDRNPSIDTTPQMQEINEAYLILKDSEARERYDKEYKRFKKHQIEQEQKAENKQEQAKKEGVHEYPNYTVDDEILGKWMDNAKKQAVDYAKQTVEDLKGMAKAGAKAAIMDGGSMLVFQIVVGIVVFLFFSLPKTCNTNTNQHISPITAKANPETVSQPIIDIVEIPNDTFINKKDYESFLIEDIGSIYIPKNMEVQAGKYKKFCDTLHKKFAQRFDYEISDNRIVFQQKGLNNQDKKGLNSYVRVIIETTIGNSGDYEKLGDTLSLKFEELAKINSQTQKQFQKSLEGTGGHIVRWEGVTPVRVNGIKAMKTSYVRQLHSNPYVHVDMYQFQNNDRVHFVTLSYRQKDSIKWKPIYSKIMKSFKLTNIK